MQINFLKTPLRSAPWILFWHLIASATFAAPSTDWLVKDDLITTTEKIENITSEKNNSKSAKESTSISSKRRVVIPLNQWVELKIKNIGTKHSAKQVRACYSDEWTEFLQDATDCLDILPGQTCTLKLFSSAPYVGDSELKIKGENTDYTLYIPLAFSIDDYFVFDVNARNRLAKVVSNEVLSPAPWGLTDVKIGAKNTKHGKKNTQLIVNTPGMSPSAAEQCYYSTWGDVPEGTWYLPAICQMTSDCTNEQPNIQENLIEYGFLKTVGDYYWSSSERSIKEAKVVYYDIPSFKVYYDKSFAYFQVLCARDIKY